VIRQRIAAAELRRISTKQAAKLMDNTARNHKDPLARCYAALALFENGKAYKHLSEAFVQGIGVDLIYRPRGIDPSLRQIIVTKLRTLAVAALAKRLHLESTDRRAKLEIIDILRVIGSRPASTAINRATNDSDQTIRKAAKAAAERFAPSRR